MTQTDQKFIDAGFPGYNTLTSNGLVTFLILLVVELIFTVVMFNSYIIQANEIPSWLAIIGLALQGLLGLAFIMAGYAKLTGEMGSQDFVLKVEYWKLPSNARYLIGIIEFGGGILLLLGFFVPSLTFVGSVIIFGTMSGAIFTHIIRIKDSDWTPSFVLFTLNLVVLIVNALPILS